MKVEAPSAEELVEEPGFFCYTVLVEVVCVHGGGGVCASHLVVDAIYFSSGAAGCVSMSPSVVSRKLLLSCF